MIYLLDLATFRGPGTTENTTRSIQGSPRDQGVKLHWKKSDSHVLLKNLEHPNVHTLPNLTNGTLA